MKSKIFVIGGALLCLLALVFSWAVSSDYRGFAGDTLVTIPRGSGTSAIARQLAQNGAIRAPWQFWLARLLDPKTTLQAGEYRFTQPASANEVLARIARGDIFYFEFTIPEGSNMFDIARLLEERHIFRAEAFLEAASDTPLIHDFAPNAKSLEGYLYPDTYRLTHSTTAPQLVRMMTSEFRREWTRLTALGKPRDANDIVVLASLVEKETGTPEERPRIASVFTNRLAKNIRLQCDPTTIYAALLDNRYRGKIHKSDLASTNPYNTYQHDGLPPGPIANPGSQSLAAALHPDATSYLYFVAKPEGGGHRFSATLAAHAQAVAQYRSAQKK